MSPQRWEQIIDICRSALHLAGDARATFLDQACGPDTTLRAEVESLLQRDAAAGSFLEPPSSADAAALLDTAPDHAMVGRRIGAYAIQGLLGRGGMGVVYEAEQESPRRIVALKVMRALPYLDDLTPRLFAREGQALARLTHPGIAAIYEAGRSPDGWYYFAMERVVGTPLTDYAREHALTLRERLELFGRVCDAAHYAHQRGVIHRDLKPSNILVVAAPLMAPASKGPEREIGQPKILDFGLARITDPGVEYTQITQPGAFRGTLAYASPEQARGEPVDVRSDVYALGIILYELLMGEPPFALRGMPLPDALHAVCHETPRQPRGIAVDLVTIVFKALEKQPDRRYAAVSSLAADVGRFLRNEPIRARPTSAFYQVRKFAARNKLPVGLAAGILLAAVGFAIFATSEAVRIAAERDKALAASKREAEARRQAEVVSDFFLRDLFEVTDPQKAKVEKLTAREILDKGATRIKERFDGDPQTQATLMLSMGRVYQQLGLLSNARELMESALTLRRETFGEQNAEVATVKFYLAGVLRVLGQPEAAEQYQQESLDTRLRLLGADDVAVAECLEDLSVILKDRGAYKEASALIEQALTIYRKQRGENSGEVAYCLDTLARLRFNQGDYAQAERLSRAALAMSRKVYGDNHPTTAYALMGLASKIRFDGRPQEALPMFEEALRIWRGLRGDESLEVAATYEGIAGVYVSLGDTGKAEELWRSALSIRRKLQGSDNESVASLLDALAGTRAEKYDFDGAEVLMRECFAVRRRISRQPSEQEAYAWGRWSRMYLDKPDYAEADRLSRAGYVASQPLLAEDNLFAVYCQHWRGLVLLKLGQYDEAEVLLRESLDRNRAILGPKHVGVGEFQNDLGSLLSERGQYAEAEGVIRDALQILGENADAFDNLAGALSGQSDFEGAEDYYCRALEIRRHLHGDEHPEVATVMLHLADLYHLQGDFDRALPLYEEALRILAKFFKPIHPDALMAHVGRGKLWMDRGKLTEAEAELREALNGQRRVLGENHPHTARTAFLLGVCLALEGKLSEPDALPGPALLRLTEVYPAQHRYVREAMDLQERMGGLSRRPISSHISAR
jgi:tetratricopeptide (TPR) repeat protein